MTDIRDAGFDDLLDAVAEGEGYYVACENGHGSLPPRRACPHCGSQDLSEEPMPESGEVATFTEVQVPTPQFGDDAPYVTAVVDFGAFRVTGVLRDVEAEAVEVGMVVGIDVGETATDGERVLVFRPR
jgi:uncharacterized OB-fold protein